jgi:probable phosphoglycerate mutase
MDRDVGMSVACRRLWLVRHCETTWDLRGLAAGQAQLPILTARGMHQSRRCADELAAQLKVSPAVAVISSDLRRAVQTARPIARVLGLDLVEDRRLRERSLGAAEGTADEAIDPDGSGLGAGRVVDADRRPRGGESVRDLYRRSTRFMAELLGGLPAGDVVLVCHAGVVRVVAAWLDGVGPDGMPWPPVELGSVLQRAVTLPAREIAAAGAR